MLWVGAIEPLEELVKLNPATGVQNAVSSGEKQVSKGDRASSYADK
jgi:hypothetical protein